MAEIRSPITNRQINNPPTRTFTVSDESGSQGQRFENQIPHFDPQAMREFENSIPFQNPTQREISETEKEIMEAKRIKKEGKERLSVSAKKRIEMLIGMTRLFKEFDIEGNLYKLQSLSSLEFREVMMAAAEFDNTVELIFETRKQILARALVVVAGVEISTFLNSYELQDRLDFIELMDHALLLRLYNEYNLLAKEAENKYAIKTENEVKEVIEDLKKP